MSEAEAGWGSAALQSVVGRHRPVWLEPEARGGGNRRLPPGSDGVDDLAGIDALQVGRGGPEVGVAELALDDVDRDALTGEFDGVRMAQLMRREPTPDPCLTGELAQLGAGGAPRPRPAARHPVDHAEQWTDR
jgi:hypothetical protein